MSHGCNGETELEYSEVLAATDDAVTAIVYGKAEAAQDCLRRACAGYGRTLRDRRYGVLPVTVKRPGQG